MYRITGPVWRGIGAPGSWLLFAFFFSLLYQSAAVVSGLGGFCASGGPYVIQTECPTGVIVWTPLSIFGGLIAVGISAFLAQGFAMPLLVWAWPILFVGLGLMFIFAGGIVGWIIGIMFLIMGAVPLVFEFRAGPKRVFLGKTNILDQRFSDREGAPRTLYAFARADPGAVVEPTPADWGLALGLTVPFAALGVWLGVQVFLATAAAAVAQ
jgi:hypothetical protein